MAAPLDGIRVLDSSGYLSGPLAGTMLADLGATVIKVEPETRDTMMRFGRTVEGRGLLYTNCNRGKRLVTLDLKSDGGREAFVRLAGDADVLITNWRAGVADRLGLTPALHDNRSLIWLRITGWGPDGPLADSPAFDGSIQSRSGLAWAQGVDQPELVRTFMADKLTSAFAVQAITAALFERTSTGQGATIELPMIDVLAYFNFPDMLQNRTALDHQPESARNEQAHANRPVRTEDGWIVISPVGGRQLKAALAAMDRSDRMDRLRSAETQHELTKRFVEICDEACAARTTASWLKTFAEHDVPVAPILDIDDHLADPQVLHNRIYDTIVDPLLGETRRARYPARFAGDPERGSSLPITEVDPTEVTWSGDRP